MEASVILFRFLSPGLLRTGLVLMMMAFSANLISADIRKFSKLSGADGKALCAIDLPSRIVIIDNISKPVTLLLGQSNSEQCILPPRVKCALLCRQDANCTGFNYISLTGSCQLYSYGPINFVVKVNCDFFTNHDFKYSCPSDDNLMNSSKSAPAMTMIPAECCSLPFTFNGALYTGCSANVLDTNYPGCLTGNRTKVFCLPPADFSVSYACVNATVPNFAGTFPLLSVNDWVVLVNRFDGSVNFTRDWIDYRDGFGENNSSCSGEYWIGLEKIHQLTTAAGATYRMRVELETLDNGTWYSAEYESFFIDPEAQQYAIHFGSYNGDSGNALASTKLGCGLNGMKFTTQDSDNDQWPAGNCALLTGGAGGGFWSQRCMSCSLTNPFGSKYYYWSNLTDVGAAPTSRLKASRMMIKRI